MCETRNELCTRQEREETRPRGLNQHIAQIPTDGFDLAICDFAARRPARLRIIVLKLDHLGDFLVGLPTMRKLRRDFPDASIRMVVGSWNRTIAETSGVADEVVVYDFFSPQGWDGAPREPIETYRALVAGRYDIAIDMRVDEDTRPLLADIDAALRCGIGGRARHPFLDLVLPAQNRARQGQSGADGTLFLPPERFDSTMPDRHVFSYEAPLRPQPRHIVHGPRLRLPTGRFTATFDVALSGWRLALLLARITLDAACNDGKRVAARRRLRGHELSAHGRDGITLAFENDDPEATWEFRIYLSGRAAPGRLRFGGVKLRHEGAEEPARFWPAELHVGEQLSLLVQLVHDRAVDLYDRPDAPAAARAGTAPLEIAIAPFSNKALREWPPAHYAELMRLLAEQLDCRIALLGTAEQQDALDRLTAQSGVASRIRNLAGTTRWEDLPALLRAADLVICNNSGVAHLAAAIGARTLAIYSASHPPQEWGARGAHSRAVMSVVPCSPCGYDKLDECAHAYRCMRQLMPAAVLREALRMLGVTADPAPADTAR